MSHERDHLTEPNPPACGSSSAGCTKGTCFGHGTSPVVLEDSNQEAGGLAEAATMSGTFVWCLASLALSRSVAEGRTSGAEKMPGVASPEIVSVSPSSGVAVLGCTSRTVGAAQDATLASHVLCQGEVVARGLWGLVWLLVHLHCQSCATGATAAAVVAPATAHYVTEMASLDQESPTQPRPGTT